MCLVGHLGVEAVKDVASAGSQRVYDVSGEPEDLSGTFHGVMKCVIPTCRESVVIAGDYRVDIAGDYRVDFDPEDDGTSIYRQFFRLRFATPALKIILPPPDTPEPVVRAIESAAAVVWADANSAANRLRVAIDEVLTAYGMPRFRNSNGKRRRIPTDLRIKEFSQYEGMVADTLEAVKWIGNQGSHESGLSVTDVLDGAELMSFALRQLYDKSEEQIHRQVRAVNRRRGLPSKRHQKSGG